MPENPDMRRVRLFLRQKVVGAGLTMRGVSIALGWKPDELTRRLKGTYDLRVEHVNAVLAYLGISPGQFWRDLEREAGAGPIIVADKTWADMLGDFRRVVQEELDKRGLHAPSAASPKGRPPKREPRR